MTSQQDNDKNVIVAFRLQQAAESIDEARFLLSGEKSPRSIINRAYYAMFYSILALLVHESYASSKHSGVLGYFNRHFIKLGYIDKDLGRWVNKAYELRQRSDYREYYTMTMEEAGHIVDKAEEFLAAVKLFLDRRPVNEAEIDPNRPEPIA